MSLTKAEISAKLASGEWKFTSTSSGVRTSYSGLSHEELITKLETGINSSQIDLLIIVSFLLATGEEKKMGKISDGLGVRIINKYATFRTLAGGTLNLLNLDDDGTFWGATETGVEKRSLIYWMASCWYRFETSLVLNYKPEFREQDPRIYIVSDLLNSGDTQIREYQMYQTHYGPLEDYYRLVDTRAQRLQHLARDVAVPRPVFQPLPFDLASPTILKRRIDHLDREDPAKRPRKE